MIIKIINWICFLITGTDLFGIFLLSVNTNKEKWNLAKILGLIAGVLSRGYILYILLTNWLLV